MRDLLSNLFDARLWPFPVRPTLENLREPEFRHLIAIALCELGLASLLVSVAILARRGRLLAVLAAAALTGRAVFALPLLFVEATPTSYRASPTGFSAAGIAQGREVFATHCVPCHGKAGDGVGGLGPIADLRLPHIWTHPVGDLFWFVSRGVTAPDGTPLMPAFETILPEAARWSVIDYVHALNAGAVTRGMDGWPHRISAPPLALSCPARNARSLDDLRGGVVRLILGAPPNPPGDVPPVNGIPVVTVRLAADDAAAQVPPGIDCTARGGADEIATYAILAGSPDGHVVPARFLIDPQGVLRSVWRKGDGVAWSDPARLLEEVRTICTEPQTFDSGDEHEHHH